MSEAEAPYEMANLTPRMTGLPMVVWVSHCGRARHDVRVKVQQTHGRRMHRIGRGAANPVPGGRAALAGRSARRQSMDRVERVGHRRLLGRHARHRRADPAIAANLAADPAMSRGGCITGRRMIDGGKP
jgi:hypothetical protein